MLVLCMVAHPSPPSVCALGFVHSNFLSRLLASVDFHCTVASRVSLFAWAMIKN